MNKIILLKDYAYYGVEKISADKLTKDNYIGVDNILPNRGGIKTSDYFYGKGKVTSFKKGDILIGNIRPYLKKIWLATFDGGCDTDVLCIRPKEAISSEFLYSALSTDFFFNYVIKGAKGSKMPRGDKKHVMEFPILDINNKQAVGNFIVNINNKIANNNAISEEVESMAKTIYDYWFLQFEFPDKDGKPYKSNGGKMVWNDQLKQEIPEGWKVSIVKNIVGDYPRTKTIESKEYNLGSLYPIIDQSKDSYICGYTDNKDYVLNVDDAIVFGDHSNKSKYVNFPFARGADGTQILNSNNPRLPNYLLYQEIIALPEIEKGYSRHFKFLKAQNITIPTLDITKKYMSIVSNMLLQQREIIKENQQLQSLRDFLLPMLMNGQVIIED